MIEKHPSPTVYHIGRSTIQHTHPDLLRPEAIRAALIKGGIALPTDPGDTAARSLLASARAMIPEGAA